jgi:serine protease Do
MEGLPMEDFLNIKPTEELPQPPPSPSPPKRTGNRVLTIIMLVALGGATLGLGLSAGRLIMEGIVSSPNDIASFSSGVVASVERNTLIIPVNPQDPNFADIIPTIKDSVVSIQVTTTSNRPFGGREAFGAGSGFIFYASDESIFIATNNHVIENANTITISLDDAETFPAHVVGTHRYSDLAVLVASRSALGDKPFTVAPLGNSDILRMGDSVIAIGNAMGEGQTVTKGIVSALGLSIVIDGTNLILDVLQTDAAVNRGNSGGPLINQYGEVIGVVTAKLLGVDIEGMGYALPMNEASVILFDLMENGAVRHAYLGITRYIEIGERERGQFNLPSTGILVREVSLNSPAAEAGLLTNDFIVYFNDRRIASSDDLRSALITNRAGEEAVLGIYRQGERMDLSVVLGNALG